MQREGVSSSDKRLGLVNRMECSTGVLEFGLVCSSRDTLVVVEMHVINWEEVEVETATRTTTKMHRTWRHGTFNL